MENSEFKLRAIEFGKNALKDPIKKKQHQEAILKAVNDPKVKARHIKAKRKTASQPGYSEMRSNITKQLYLDGKLDKTGVGKSGYFFSKKNNKQIHYRSSYELVAYELLEQMSKVKSYETEPFGIQYEYLNKKRWTIPDILITYTDNTKELIEVKPEFKLKFKDQIVKLKAMEKHALEQGWDFNIWSEKQLNLN